jgi:hypothetical protein
MKIAIAYAAMCLFAVVLTTVAGSHLAWWTQHMAEQILLSLKAH